MQQITKALIFFTLAIFSLWATLHYSYEGRYITSLGNIIVLLVAGICFLYFAFSMLRNNKNINAGLLFVLGSLTVLYAGFILYLLISALLAQV